MTTSTKMGTVGVVICILLVVVGGPGFGRQAELKIQPGGAILTESGSNCTLNWVYEGMGRRAGQVFIGTAAHCVAEVGEPIQLQDTTFGTPSMVFGRVGFISENFDYSLIRISRKHLSHVDPSMKGYPQIPSGLSTQATAQDGDVIQFSGHGTGFHVTRQTQEGRFGILHEISESAWSAAGPVTPGDSGGPSANVTDGNTALGVVDVICAGIGCTGAGGVTIEALLADAASKGFPIKLKTV